MMIAELLEKAKNASEQLKMLSPDIINKILLDIADLCDSNQSFLLKENEKDLALMDKKNPLYDRLKLTNKRLDDISSQIRKLVELPSPLNRVLSREVRPNGLDISKISVPFGVIGIIYEARPNVTSDAAGLCFKSGNAVILRGGSEAINSNKAIAEALREGLKSVGLVEDAVQLVEDTSREVATEMMKLNDYIDVLIPRGGAGLIKAVVNNATVPVIETGTGNCHIYVDEDCDFEMAKNIIINAKTSRPSVCNAAEKLLINEKIAGKFMPIIFEALRENGVEIRGDESLKALDDSVILASEEEWYNEYLDYTIGVKIIKDIDEAINHINKFGSGHSEAIVTKSYEASQIFLQKVNAAAVYVNASTRFTDGEEFGFGAEIGISTQKLHARGPMGLKELTTIKYIIFGNGQIR